jgi:hypothetical protein
MGGIKMQKETVSTPKKRSSLKIYAIKGFCTRLGGQDDDGIDNEDVRLEVASDSEALEQFRALIEEKKEKRCIGWGGNKEEERVWHSINFELSRGAKGKGKKLAKVNLRHEKLIVETVEIVKAGRGWIDPKDWLSKEEKEKLADGSIKSSSLGSRHFNSGY